MSRTAELSSPSTIRPLMSTIVRSPAYRVAIVKFIDTSMDFQTPDNLPPAGPCIVPEVFRRRLGLGEALWGNPGPPVLACVFGRRGYRPLESDLCSIFYRSPVPKQLGETLVTRLSEKRILLVSDYPCQPNLLTQHLLIS